MTTHTLAIATATGFACLIAGIYLKHLAITNRDASTGKFTATGAADLLVKALNWFGWYPILICIVIACLTRGCAPTPAPLKPSAALAPVPGVLKTAAADVKDGATGNRTDAHQIATEAETLRAALPADLLSPFGITLESIKGAAGRISTRSDDFDRIAVLLMQQSANVRTLTGQVAKVEGQLTTTQKKLDDANSATERLLRFLKVAGVCIVAAGIGLGFLAKNFRLGAAIAITGAVLSVAAVAFSQIIPAIKVAAFVTIGVGVVWVVVESILRKSVGAALRTNPLKDIQDALEAAATPKAPV